MEKIRVVINGFGRIGRITFKELIRKENIEVIAVNDLTDPKTLAHLLKYDSVHGKFSGDVSYGEKDLTVNGKTIKVTAEKDPAALPWKDLNIDVVLECTGHFTDEEGAKKHLTAGAGKVVISAPAKGNIKTVVLGVNNEVLTGEERIVSNASCTTNNVAPMIKIVNDNWGISSGFINTIHAYTGDQNLVDGPHKDLRRARAAANSIIPTTTGAAKAIIEIFPALKGKLAGSSMRVPVPCGSVTDLTLVLENKATTEEINAAFKKAASGSMKGILEYTDDSIVSADIISNPASCIFDSQLTTVMGNVVKVVGWYDNEMGYSHRLAELVAVIGEMVVKEG
jgi:glyceraldehyde 3-phosphate dehydrogenase